MSLLDVRNLIVDLPTASGWIRPVNDVSLQLAPAESLGLVGESGSGKTMLALALMGLLPPGDRYGLGRWSEIADLPTSQPPRWTSRCKSKFLSY
jgi:ABC-type dipeptide/oligopeptide/nickel transport system ATPase component